MKIKLYVLFSNCLMNIESSIDNSIVSQIGSMGINSDSQIISDQKISKSIRNFNGNEVAKQFINYFYSTWITNTNQFIVDEVIKPYSKIVYNGTIYEGVNFMDLLNKFSSNGLQFENCSFEILDSGSRQLYILVNGIIKNTVGTNYFSQSFMIAYAGEKQSRKWILMNSLIKFF